MTTQAQGIVSFFTGQGFLGLAEYFAFSGTVDVRVCTTTDVSTFVRDGRVTAILETVRDEQSEVVYTELPELLRRALPADVRLMDEQEVQTLLQELQLSEGVKIVP